MIFVAGILIVGTWAVAPFVIRPALRRRGHGAFVAGQAAAGLGCLAALGVFATVAVIAAVIYGLAHP